MRLDTLSVLLIERLTCGVRVSVSLSLLLLGSESVVPTGTVIEAVLTSEPVAVELTVPVTINVTELPTGKLTALLVRSLEPVVGS